MKIAFINPPWFVTDEANNVTRRGIRAGSRWPHTVPLTCLPGTFQFGSYLPFPMFMASATSYAQKHCPNDTILFRDSIARNETYNQFFTWLYAEKPDLIFVESATPSWAADQDLISRMGMLLPNSRFVVTGTITSVRSDEILALKGVVAAIKGEYEKNSVKVIQGATGVLEHDLMTEEEMNAAPFPYFEQETARNYWDSNPQGAIYPHAQLWSSRGCGFRCNFCVWPAVMTGNDPDGLHKRKVRFHSKEYLSALLDELVGKYGFRSIYWDDDTVNLLDRHTLNLCEVMRKANLPWSAMCRADTSSREVWKEMKDSGCYGVKIGFESGSQRIIDRVINKKLDLSEAEATGRYLTELGLNWHGTFMIGHPSETPEEVAMTHALIKRCLDNGMKTYQLSGTAVHDGTPLDTLRRTGEPMKAYPDAKIDAGFMERSDGNAKAEELRQ